MGTGETRARASGTVGEILVAAVIFAVAMTATWMTHGRDGPLAGVFLAGAGAEDRDDVEDASDTVVSYGPDGELIHAPPSTTAPAGPDPEAGTGPDATVPSTTTTVPADTGSTAPPTSDPGTSTSTTEPPTTTTSTTEPTTTTSTTEPTTTTSTTEPTTTTSTPGDPPG